MIVAGCLALAACGRLLPDAPGPGQATGPRPYLPSQTPVPSRDNLIDRPIDAGTFAALQRATGDIETCAAVLSAARVTFSPTPDRVNTATCGLTQAGVLGPDYGTRARMQPNAPTTTCALAAAISVWRRQSVEPAAREILGASVDQIDHMGVYACRPVNSQAGNRPSAHSRAAALDFAGVRLSDGRRITVTNNWNKTRDEIFARLRTHFSEAQIVELTLRITLCGFFNRFNDALQIEEEAEVQKL